MATNVVCVLFPPKWSIRARVIKLGNVPWLREADVESTETTSRVRIRAVPNLAAAFILVHTQVEVVLQVAACLRPSVAGDGHDLAGDRVWCTDVVLQRVPHERDDIPKRCLSHAQHVGILC